jgi:hypothetical protein
MSHEHEQQAPDPGEPLHPIPLPPDLAAFLAQQGPYACLTQATDQGTAYVLKPPAAEIVRARGPVPTNVRHQLFGQHNAPVIRTVLTLYDDPGNPLKFESFINVADPDQRADFASLAEQEQLLVLFYDETLQHRLSKRIPSGLDTGIPEMLARADRLRAAIPTWRFDFDRAKADVLRQTALWDGPLRRGGTRRQSKGGTA